MTGRPRRTVAVWPSARLARWVWAARLVLAVEAAWPPLVWLACAVAWFVAFILFDIAVLLPVWAHVLVLAVFVGALALALAPLRRWRWPAMEFAARRLEADSGLPHRPLQSLVDTPVSGDPAALILWARHRDRAMAALTHLHLRPPMSDMAVRDPWGWRAAALLALVAALSGAGGDWRDRLGRALTPRLDLPALSPQAVDVWVTPPAYTGLGPMVLPAGGGGPPLVVLRGSQVLAVARGGMGRPSLRAGDAAVEFAPQNGGVGDDSLRAEAHIDSGTKIEIRHWGRSLAAWPIQVHADATPSVEFAATPEAGERGRLHVAVTASDDYGLARLWLSVRRVGAPAGEPALEVALPLPPGNPRQAGASSWHDLTAHPWAGLPVLIRPLAQDALGQQGQGEAVAMTLPERGFLHPAARVLIEQRRLITQSRSNARTVQGVLDRLAAEPERFGGDLIVFLAIRTVRHGLDTRDFDLDEIQDVLWNAALRVEDGDLATSEQALEDLRHQLEQALDGDAGDDRISALLDRFRAALARYVQALGTRTRPAAEGPGGAATISDQELLAMVDALRAMAGAGARDGLRQGLRDLTQLLDQLQTRQPQAPSAALAGTLGDLREVGRRQQRLLDNSHRQSMQPGAPAQPQAARDQQDLRRALAAAAARLAQGLGEAPAGLMPADQAMADAAASLERGEWGDAAASQAQALYQVQQALRQAAEDMAAGGVGAGVPRDPLGRPLGRGPGAADDGATRLPDQGELGKARAIMDELRRRAGDGRRPEDERDYLRRLLRQF